MPRSDTNIVAHNTILQVILKVIVLAISLATLSILARNLPPNMFGDYTVVTTLFALFTTISEFGVGQIAVREMMKAPQNMPSLIWESSVIKFVIASIVTFASVIFIQLSGYSIAVKMGYAIMALSLSLTAVQVGYQSALQAKLKIYLASVGGVLARAVQLVVIILLAYRLAGKHIDLLQVYYLVIWGSVLGTGVSLLYTLWVGMRESHISISWDRKSLKNLTQDSWPLWIIGIFSLLHFKVDTLILSQLKSSYAVGIYGLSTQFLEYALLMPGLLIASVYPIISANVTSQPERVQRIIQKTLGTLAILAFPMAVGVYIAAPQVIQIISGGGGYSESVAVLQILSASIIASYLNSIFAPVILAYNGQKSILILSVIAVSVNILLNLLLIPKYTYMGSAYATVFSEFFGMLMMGILVWRKYGLSLNVPMFAKPLLASAVMFVVLKFVHFGQLLVIVPVGALIYFGVLYSLGGIDKDILSETLKVRYSK